MAGLLRLPLGPQTSEQDAADEVQVAHAKEHKEEEAHLASRLAVGRRRGGLIRAPTRASRCRVIGGGAAAGAAAAAATTHFTFESGFSNRLLKKSLKTFLISTYRCIA